MKKISAILILYSSIAFGQFHCDSVEGIQVYNRSFKTLPEDFTGIAKSCDSTTGWIETREFKNGVAIASRTIMPVGLGGTIIETKEQGGEFSNSIIAHDPESGNIVSKTITKNQGKDSFGQTSVYDPKSGKIISKASALNGQLDGIMKVWHLNGQLSKEINYVKGEEHGLSRSWSENGKLLYECRMVEGGAVDTCRRWNEEGMLIVQRIHDEQGTTFQRWWIENDKVQTEISNRPKTKKTKTETINEENIEAVPGQMIEQQPQEIQEMPKDSIIYDFPDIEPMFPGGQEELQKYISKSVNYPEEALKSSLEDKIYLSFIIEKNGSITNIVAERGKHQILIDEAIRVVRLMPSWNPGKVKNEAVRTSYRLPIFFTL